MGRFINADVYVSTGQGILGNNMFAYCGNNPVIRYDSSGNYFCVLGAETYGFLGNTLDQYIGGKSGGIGGGYAIEKDDLIPDITHTKSITVSAAMGDYIATKSLGLSTDYMGSHALQDSTALGVTSGTGTGFGVTHTFTNAKSVFDLEGESTNVGFSFGTYYVLSIDLVIFSPASDPSSTKYGISIGVSVGVGLEAHCSYTNTSTLFSWKPFEWLTD